jgi:hypothetical protein
MVCAICKVRRARRFCPGVNGEICSICCGTEREVTVECPLNCTYLRDARRHERIAPLEVEQLPHPEIKITEEFVAEHEPLLSAVCRSLLSTALGIPGAVDSDVREAIAAMIRTQQTLSSGLYYQSVPENTIAAQIFRALESAVADFRREETEKAGMTRTRDSDVLAILAFLERLEVDRANGRRKGRAFLGFLLDIYPAPSGEGETGLSSSLLVG